MARVGSLGPVRDLDVLLEHLRAEVETLDPDGAAAAAILGVLEAEREQARTAMVEALRSDRYLALLRQFELDLETLAGIESSVTLRSLALRDLRRLRKDMRALGDDSTDEELHSVRIRAKRSRYTAELASAVEKRFAGLVDALKRLQDTIGDHQDAVVAEERIRSVSDSLAAGRLVERERGRRRRARAEVPEVWRAVEQAAGKV